LLLNVSEFVILHPLPYLPSRVFSFNPFIQNTRKVTEEGYLKVGYFDIASYEAKKPLEVSIYSTPYLHQYRHPCGNQHIPCSAGSNKCYL
ncbi:hypothetical protein, partial [Coleofasciculus sp. FACHB-542]|uniref:hypothetical protein n=1 Tax=Coleofasciculus sp. FACHB-542 TaxID=2692787 RepID=UPI001A7E4308